MKKILLISAIIIMTGCGVSKKAQQGIYHAVESTQTIEQASASTQENKIEERAIKHDTNLATNIKEHRIEYDTNKPIDPNTGRPPIKSEVFSESSTRDKSLATDNTKIIESKKDSIIIVKSADENRSIDSSMNITRERDGSKQITRITWLVVSLCVLAIIIGIIGIKWRLRKIKNLI